MKKPTKPKRKTIVDVIDAAIKKERTPIRAQKSAFIALHYLSALITEIDGPELVIDCVNDAIQCVTKRRK